MICKQVPSSREAIDTTSSWNNWIKTKLPQVFEEAAKNFVQLTQNKGRSEDIIASSNTHPGEQESATKRRNMVEILNLFFQYIPSRKGVRKERMLFFETS